MGWKRKSSEKGHRRKFLVILDDTPECARAVAYSAKRAESTNAGMVMLYIIKPGEFQHWLGVEDVMRAEAQEQAQDILKNYKAVASEIAQIEPEQVIKEGVPKEVIPETLSRI